MLLVVQVDRVLGPFAMGDADVEGGEIPSTMVQKIWVKFSSEAFLCHEVEDGMGRVDVGGVLWLSSKQGDKAACFVKERPTGAKSGSGKPWKKRRCPRPTFQRK